jgi:hypothetical protein
MSTRARWIAALCFSAAGSATAQVDSRLLAEIRPSYQAYEACALQHIRSIGAARPTSTFEQNEASIRPACGGYIDQVIAGIMRYGFDRSQAIETVRNVYQNLQPRLRAAFDAAAAEELRKQEKARTEARVAEQRRHLIAEANDQLVKCLEKGVEDLAIFSVEPAETVATAVTARCMEERNRLVRALAIAVEIAPEVARRELAERLANDRAAVIARIVTLRAEFEKLRLLEQTKQAPVPSDRSIGGKAY